MKEQGGCRGMNKQGRHKTESVFAELSVYAHILKKEYAQNCCYAH